MKTIDIGRATQLLMMAINKAADQYVKGWTPSTGDDPVADPIICLVNKDYLVAPMPTPIAAAIINNNAVKAVLAGAFRDMINEEGSPVIAALVVSEAFYNHMDQASLKDKAANGGMLQGLEGTSSCIMGTLYYADGLRIFCQHLKVGERDGPIVELSGPGVKMRGNMVGVPVSRDDLVNGAEE